MNEVSNGPSGNQEYVEFVVVSNTVTYTCTNPNPPCIDIRGWIFDDNSGYHGSGGIATGAVRFSQDPIWSCIPLGTIILIYNNGDRNPAIPPDDLSMSDGNCTIIAPMNSALFETNSTTPGAVACSYPNTGWTSGGNWNSTLFANTGDCARIVNLAGCEVFSVCWGSDNTNNLIYFSGSGGQKVWYFNDVDPSNQANWTSGSASPSPGNQTPGTVNNAANAAYIAQFNNGCQPITQTSVTATSVNAGCSCTGSATANASGSIGDYTYVWYDASMNPIGQTNAIATNLCVGVYYVTATSHIGCSATTSISIGSSGSTSVAVNSQTICSGNSTILNATPSIGGGTYLWSPDGQTSQSISINPSSTTTYSVSYTLSGCSTTTIGTITVKSTPTITVNSATICTGQTTTLTVSGATTYTWNTGSTSSSSTNNPALTTNYTVTGTVNGCTNTAVATISVNPNPIITVNSSTVCPGQTATLTANGATTYTWNTGSTANSIMPTPASNTNYTVTGTTAGCVNTGTASVIVGSSISLSINSPSICAGQSTTLTVNGASTYTWNTGSATNSIVVNPASTTNYSVIGTSGTCTGTVLTSVNVSPMPTVTVNSSTICSGQTATLTANGANSYLWNTGSTSNNISDSPSSTNNYTVVGTTAGCSNMVMTTITVGSSITLGINTPTICAGQTATLIANGANSYTWSTGATGNSIVVNPTSNTTYSVTGVNGFCSGTGTTIVTVNPLPVITVNSSTLCVGQTATLTANGATTYTWNNGSAGNIITISPASTTNYAVIGTTAGCSNTMTTTVNVNPLPNVAVNSETICVGQTATLLASGANNYTWNTGATTNTLNISPISTTNYTIIGTTAGCTNTTIATVTVIPLPNVTATSVTICAGQTTTLTAVGANNYVWNTGATSSSITSSPSSNINFTVTGTNAGCSNTAVTTITVNPLPIITVNSTTICAGQTTTLSANGASTYSWNNGATTSSITSSPNSNVTYTVTGTLQGCQNTNTATVIINQTPLIIVNSSTVCTGQTATLIASGANNYVWNTGATSNSITTAPNTNTTYTVVGTNAGCSTTKTATVTVNPLPVLTVNSSTICTGETTTLSANGAITYIWNTGAVSKQIAVSPTSSTTYTVIGSNNGCSSIAVTFVAVNTAPQVLFNADKLKGCAPLCVNFSDLSIITTGSINNWVWTINNGIVSTNQNPQYCFDNSGLFDVGLTVVSSNGCSSTFTVNNMIEVYTTPIADFTNDNSITDILNPEITFTNYSSNANSYNWNFGDSNGSSETNPIHIYQEEGTYLITLIAHNQYGCEDIAKKEIKVNGLFTFYAPNTFTPDENKQNDVFLPMGTGWNPDKYILRVFDRWGLEIFKTNDPNKGWDGTILNGSEIALIDTYTWKVELEDIFKKQHSFIGHITILR